MKFSSDILFILIFLSRYPRNIKEWMWDYANSLGYLTSYGVDTGNGLFGTRTVCKVIVLSFRTLLVQSSLD